MAIVFVQDVEGGNQETYDKINAKVDSRDNPPAGLIIHTAGPTETGWRVVDVWESEEDLRRFREERLMPAIRETVGQLPSEPKISINEAYDLVRP